MVMKTLKATLIISLSFTLMVGALVTNPAAAQESKIKPEMKLHPARIINITSDMMQIRRVEVNQGTPVIWLNNTRRLIEIEFIGKQVTMACESPSGFFVNEQGTFSSQKIMPASTASLCFIEKGEYDYEVSMRAIGADDPFVRKTYKGKVIVK
jgi:hypothetical protein